MLSISSFAGSVEGVDSSTTKDYRVALTRQDIAEKALSSTVVLVVKDKNGKLIKYGSGFVIDDGKVVTNYHVVLFADFT